MWLYLMQAGEVFIIIQSLIRTAVKECLKSNGQLLADITVTKFSLWQRRGHPTRDKQTLSYLSGVKKGSVYMFPLIRVIPALVVLKREVSISFH